MIPWLLMGTFLSTLCVLTKARLLSQQWQSPFLIHQTYQFVVQISMFACCIHPFSLFTSVWVPSFLANSPHSGGCSPYCHWLHAHFADMGPIVIAEYPHSVVSLCLIYSGLFYSHLQGLVQCPAWGFWSSWVMWTIRTWKPTPNLFFKRVLGSTVQFIYIILYIHTIENHILYFIPQLCVRYPQLD